MLLLHNARIFTLDPSQPLVSAVAIRDGKVIAVGSDLEILALEAPGVQKQNLNGCTVWPGLTDAHLHLQHYALGLQYVDCETSTQAECLDRVAQRAVQTPKGSWIRGHGWNQNDWQEGYGTASQLDAIAPDHPVYLTAKSLHASWANSLALNLAGINGNSTDPQGGQIHRDLSGQPTGILFENATGLIENVIPQPGIDDVRLAIEKTQQTLIKIGLTGVHDFDRSMCFQALQHLDENHSLLLRVVKSISHENLDQAIEVGLHSGFGSEHLRLGSVKLFSDGALGPQTAAMLTPYEGSIDNVGFLLLTADEIFDIGHRAAGSGISLATHAIGDQANREVINGYAMLRAYESSHNLPLLRHRIEHVQVLHPDDLNRLAELNITASMQPIHTTSDMFTADRYWGSRARYAYAFRSLLERGTRVAFGSDAPVESPNPFWGIHAAVTRRRPDGSPGIEGWQPQEKISLQHALEAYTTGPAYLAGVENHLGRLSPGYLADLIVLPSRLLSEHPDNIYQLRPQAVMIAGEWVWQQ